MKAFLCIIGSVLFFSCTNHTESGYIDVGNLKIYYTRSGQGDPLLFLHAGLMDHTMWNKQVAFFEKTHTVITIDLPGSGLSSGKDSVILVAEVIRTCMDELHIPKASVIGLSVGSACAVEFVLANPDRVNKLVLASPGANGLDKVLTIDTISLNAIKGSQEAQRSKDVQKMADAFTATWAVGPFRSPTGMDTSVSSYVHANALQTLQTHTKDSWANLQVDPPAATRLATISKPLLLIYGDKDLPFIKSCAEYLHQTVKGSKLVVFENAAHMLNMEMPDKFNSQVSGFLR